MFEAIITQKKFFEENDRKAIMGIKWKKKKVKILVFINCFFKKNKKISKIYFVNLNFNKKKMKSLLFLFWLLFFLWLWLLLVLTLLTIILILIFFIKIHCIKLYNIKQKLSNFS